MALIELQVTDCCGCCECSEVTSGVNAFQISRAEYLAYRKGGVWTLNGAIAIAETGTDRYGGNYSSSSNGNGSPVDNGSGCSYSVAGNISCNGYIHTPTFDISGPSTGHAYLNVYLSASGDVYYVKFKASIGESDRYISTEGTDTGYPPTKSITVDGKSLSVVGIWDPSWSALPTYNNTSSITLLAAFTPNA